MTRLSPLVLVVSLAAAVLAGCGDDDDSGNAAGSGNTGGSNGGSGLPPGVTRISCYKASDKSCSMRGESSDAGIQSRKSDCTSGGGTVVDQCPSASLAGCCVIAGLGDCYYDASTATQAQQACSVGGAQWTTSAP